MKSKQNVLNVIKKDAFMTSIDLKYVFYSVPVAAHHQKYLKIFVNKYLKFTSMPNGYRPTMRIFSKITKDFNNQDARPYLSCICRRFLLSGRLLWKLFEECKRWNNNAVIIRLYHTFKNFITPFYRWVQMSQGYRATTRRQFLLFSSQEFLVLNCSTLEGWETELTYMPPSAFETGLEIQCFNHKATSWRTGIKTRIKFYHKLWNWLKRKKKKLWPLH